MKLYYFTFCITLLIFLWLCNAACNTKNEILLQFDEINSLLLCDKDSLAAEIFKTIPQPEDSSEALAYYNFINAKINCRKQNMLAPEVLDFSIEFYKKNNDSSKLAYSYNYKSIFLLYYSQDKYEAMKYNDNAEKITEKLHDNILKYNVFGQAWSLATYYYDTDKCIEYALKALKVAEEMQDKKRIAYPSLILSICYLEKDIIEQAEIYMNKCLNFINYFDENAKSSVYNTFGEIMERKNDYTIAEQYFLKSVSINGFHSAYRNLAKLFLKQGRINDAEKYYERALVPAAYDSNAQLMLLYAEALKNSGDLKKALKIYENIVAEKDSLISGRKDVESPDIQEKKKEPEKKKTNDSFLDFFIYSILLILSLLVVIFVRKLKILQQLLQKRDEKIEIQETKITDYNTELKDINVLLKNKKEDFEKIYCVGKKLHQDINEGKSIAQWTPEEERIFVNYFKIIDYDFVTELDKKYDSLTNHSKVFLILEKIIDKQSLRIQILGIAASSYRSAKSRIDSQKK